MTSGISFKEPMEWKPEHFTCDKLRAAWVGYKKAIEHLETHLVVNTGYTQHLLEKHKERVHYIEQVQRILNHFNAFNGDYFL